MADVTARQPRSPHVTIALVSAALVGFVLLLLRVCAARQHTMFGVLVVANGLLGFAAGGALLALCERRWRLLPDVWVRRASLFFLVSLPLAWAWVVHAPVALDGSPDLIQVLGFSLACAVPCACAGAAVGLLLSAHVREVHAVHGAERLGAGLACILGPFVLWHIGAGGAFLGTVVLAAAACVASAPLDGGARAMLVLAAAGAGFWMQSIDTDFPIAGRMAFDVGNQQVTASAPPILSRWSHGARVEVVALDPDGAQFLPVKPGKGTPAPRQWWIASDGAGSVLSDFGGHPDAAQVLDLTCHAVAMRLKHGTGASVCVLGVGGGADLWAAKIHDPAHVRGIEPEPGVLEVHQTVARAMSQPLLDDPRVELVCDDGRSALMRSVERYDVIQVGDDLSWSSLRTGAHAVAPDYRFTVQACRTMYERLNDGGILQITRAVTGPEAIRLLTSLFHGMPEAERETFRTGVAVLRGADQRLTVLLRKGGFAPSDGEQLRRFATEAGVDGVLLPDSDPLHQLEGMQEALQRRESELAHLDQEIAVRNVGADDQEIERLQTQRRDVLAVLPGLRTDHAIAAFVLGPDKTVFAENYAWDVTPATDDRPFCFRLLPSGVESPETATAAETGTDTGAGARWLSRQLLASALAALGLLLLPLLLRGGATSGTRDGALRFLVYFAGTAIGAVGIAVAMMQKFTLLLGQPVWSVVVTLGSLFVFAGVGARLSRSVLYWEPQRGRVVAIGGFVAAAAVAFASPGIVDLCIGLSFGWRAVVVILVTAPIGMLIGMPLPHGLQVVERVNPSLLPWACAVSACTTVVGALLAWIVAMDHGFAAVLFAAGVAWLPAFVAIDSLARQGDPAATDGDLPAEADGPVDASGRATRVELLATADA